MVTIVTDPPSRVFPDGYGAAPQRPARSVRRRGEERGRHVGASPTSRACSSIQRHFETARNGRVPGPAMGTPSAICKVIERDASPFGLQTQLRPSLMAHSPNLPEGSSVPTVQKMTSLCGVRAR